MREFRVSAAAFFSATTGAENEARLRDQGRCADTMPPLIERFELRGRDVLSLGPGLAYEEFWMHQAGCKLTLVDIDEYGTIAPLLAGLPQVVGDARDLRYVVGDARVFVTSPEAAGVSCLYVSSFTPDELRRAEIQRRHITSLKARTARVVNRIARRATGKEWFAQTSWPPDAAPLCDIVSQSLACLAPAGIFLLQSYAAGVDIAANPHFVHCLQKQLRAHGIELVEFMHYSPEYSGVWLCAGIKSGPAEALEYAARVRSRAELTRFHGRSQVRTGIRRIPIIIGG